MPEMLLFAEDHAHQHVLDALIRREARTCDSTPTLHWRAAARPDALLVATDANCKGLQARRRELLEVTGQVSLMTILAVPDPHVERWLLLDSAAFKAALGRGCDAPDLKCERSRHKKRLVDAVLAAGVAPTLGGLEFADDIVGAMDLDRVAQADPSFGAFLADLRSLLKGW
jgi:hypothetical protein